MVRTSSPGQMTNFGGRNGDNDNNKSRAGMNMPVHNEHIVRLMYNYQCREPMSCELCGDMLTVPVSYHMLKTHPGCGQSSNGRGYTSNGTYKSGWSGDCGEGGIAWYLLCESCRHGYMKNAKPQQAPVVSVRCADPPEIRRANNMAAKMAEQIAQNQYPYEDSDDSDDSSIAAKAASGVQFCSSGEQSKQLAG